MVPWLPGATECTLPPVDGQVWGGGGGTSQHVLGLGDDPVRVALLKAGHHVRVQQVDPVQLVAEGNPGRMRGGEGERERERERERESGLKMINPSKPTCNRLKLNKLSALGHRSHGCDWSELTV